MNTLKKVLNEVADVVAQRETINHGTIRCLHTQEAVDSILSAEGCDKVDTGTIGDDDLAEKLREVAENPEWLLAAHAGDLAEAITALYMEYVSADVADYLEADREDELCQLDKLIAAAEQLVSVVS